jgi:hypothetical protein
MKHLTLIIILIFLVSCIPTTNTVDPSEENPLDSSDSTTSEQAPDEELEEAQSEPIPIQTEPSENDENESESELPPTQENAPMPSDNLEEPNPHKLPQVNVAKEDLATRLNILAENIEIVKVEYVTWPNGALGCPQPDMVYTQVLQDGLKIQLRVDGIIYNYHSGGSRDPFLCLPSTTKSTQPDINLEDYITPPSSGSFDE